MKLFGNSVPMGMTWQLERHRSSSEDGLAGLFCWGPSMLVSLSLSSGTSSQCSPSRLFWSSALRKMVWFLVSGSLGEDGWCGEGYQPVLCLFTPLLSWWCPSSTVPAVLHPETLCLTLSREQTSSLGPGHGRDSHSGAWSWEETCLLFKQIFQTILFIQPPFPPLPEVMKATNS